MTRRDLILCALLAGATVGALGLGVPRWLIWVVAMGRRLVGFDHEAVIRAMGMMSGGVVVWKHPSAAPAHPKS